MKRILLIAGLIIALVLPADYASSQEGTLKKRGQTTTPTPEGTSGTLEKRGAKKDNTKTANAKTTASKNMMKGKVMSLAGYMSGKMNTAAFKDNDQPLVLVSGEGKAAKVYFIYNTDGTYAGKKLMSYQANKMVSVTGKTKTVNGVNVIYAENIQNVD